MTEGRCNAREKLHEDFSVLLLADWEMVTEKRLQKLILCRNKLGKSKKFPNCSSGGDWHWTFGSRNRWKWSILSAI
jgi:hypothetical protein